MFLFHFKRQIKDKTGWIIFGLFTGILFIIFTFLAVLNFMDITKVPTILIITFLCTYNLSCVIKFYKNDKKSSLMNMEIRNNKSIWKIFFVRMFIIKIFTFSALVIFLIISLSIGQITQLMIENYFTFFWQNYWSFFLVDLSVFCFFLFISQFTSTIWTAISSFIITILITIGAMFTLIFTLMSNHGDPYSDIPDDDYKVEYYNKLISDNEIMGFAKEWKTAFDSNNRWIEMPEDHFSVNDCELMTEKESIGFIYYYGFWQSDCKTIQNKHNEIKEVYENSIGNNDFYTDFNNFYYYLLESLIVPLDKQFNQVMKITSKIDFYDMKQWLNELKNSNIELVPYINPISKKPALSKEAIYKIAEWALDWFYILDTFDLPTRNDFESVSFNLKITSPFIRYISFATYNYFFKFLFYGNNLKESNKKWNYEKKIDAFKFIPTLVYDKLTSFISATSLKNRYVDYIFLDSGYSWYREINENLEYDESKDLESEKYLIKDRELTYDPAGPILTILFLTITTFGFAYLIYWKKIRV